MSERPHRYDSYLLRLWYASGPAGVTWRILLENPHSGARHAFASLEAMADFLIREFSDLDMPSGEDT